MTVDNGVWVGLGVFVGTLVGSVIGVSVASLSIVGVAVDMGMGVEVLGIRVFVGRVGVSLGVVVPGSVAISVGPTTTADPPPVGVAVDVRVGEVVWDVISCVASAI